MDLDRDGIRGEGRAERVLGRLLGRDVDIRGHNYGYQYVGPMADPVPAPDPDPQPTPADTTRYVPVEPDVAGEKSVLRKTPVRFSLIGRYGPTQQ